MSLKHPKPAPATPSAGKRAGALPIRSSYCSSPPSRTRASWSNSSSARSSDSCSAKWAPIGSTVLRLHCGPGMSTVTRPSGSRRTLSLRVAMGGPPLSVKGPDPEFTAPTGPAYRDVIRPITCRDASSRPGVPQVSSAFGGGLSQDARRTDAGPTLASKACHQRKRLAFSSAACEFGHRQ